LKELGTPCLIHQPVYSIFNRWIEKGLLDVLETEGVGCIAFSPLAQGMLSDKYLKGIPEGSRASKPNTFLKAENITEEKMSQVSRLNDIAKKRGQSLAQMAIAWVLRHKNMTSALIGASSAKQLDENVAALKNLELSNEELQAIDSIAGAG
jgi:L-glyceraldehyde 3-phosphate reductase